MTIRKAVIAVAGLGTRFLPATKVVPKELLPVLDKPVVQYLVEEVVDSGIEEVILVTRPSVGGIEDHFQPKTELDELVSSNAALSERLQRLNSLSERAKLIFEEQSADLPYGNGSPLLAAKKHLNPEEGLVYLFGDDMVLSQTPCVRQLLDSFEKHAPAAVLAAQNVPREETPRYGIVNLKPNTDPPEMESIIEKPNAEEAPSTLAQFGRFVFPYRIVEILEEIGLGKDNELWLADATDKLCKEARVLVQEIEGTWHTTGDPLRFLITSIEYGLCDETIGADLAAYLRSQSGD